MSAPPLSAPAQRERAPGRATRSLRIAHVAASYAPCIGGSERMLQQVSERLVQRGHRVTVLTFDCASLRDQDGEHRAGLPAQEDINGVTVRRLDPRHGWLQRLHRAWIRLPGGWKSARWLLGPDADYWLGSPSGIRMLRPLLRMDLDVITSLNWYWGIAYWAGVAARLRGVPHVAIPVLHTEMDWANRPIHGRIYRSTAASIVLTDAEREFVEAHGGPAVTVAGAGADPARFEHRDGASLRARIGAGNRPIVAFVGGQSAPKGVPTLIDAMQLVWRTRPDAMLLLAGPVSRRDAATAARLQALAPEERARVAMLDDFADTEGPSILDACDVLALPSIEDSFGMVMIEAWMCGKPVIGADIPSTRCIVEHGVDGLLVQPFDAHDLAGAIERLLANPLERREFGERGRAKAHARYTWDRVTDAWEATLLQAVAHP